MQNGKFNVESLSQAPEQMQKNYGIGATRHANTGANPGCSHVITSDDFRDPIEQAVGQYRYCKSRSTP
jgi:hypothetical protein